MSRETAHRMMWVRWFQRQRTYVAWVKETRYQLRNVGGRVWLEVENLVPVDVSPDGETLFGTDHFHFNMN